MVKCKACNDTGWIKCSMCGGSGWSNLTGIRLPCNAPGCNNGYTKKKCNHNPPPTRVKKDPTKRWR